MKVPILKRTPTRYSKAIAIIKELEQKDRYLGAFIFGSVAEGTSTSKSDLDVRVIVDAENPCTNINHPVIDDYKLDLTFRSLLQEREHNEKMIQSADRVPNLTSAIILFDKTGQLKELKELAQAARPKSFSEKDHQLAHFLIYHANNKVERFLKDDPIAALFAMHCNLQEVLKVHYQLKTRWWKSSKALLQDIRATDPVLARLVEEFIMASSVEQKYTYWSKIIDYALIPLGGRQPIDENNCNCEVCSEDLKYFLPTLKNN